MADTVASLQARLDAIVRARDSGVLRIRHGDEDTIFRSLDEMNRIVRSLQNQIDALNGVKPRSKVNYITQKSRGIGDGFPFDAAHLLDKGFE